jgi:hypothetical protein
MTGRVSRMLEVPEGAPSFVGGGFMAGGAQDFVIPNANQPAVKRHRKDGCNECNGRQRRRSTSPTRSLVLNSRRTVRRRPRKQGHAGSWRS